MALVFMAGLALGTLFFGGLWLTVKKMVTSKAPAFLFLGSFLFRGGITLLGFYYIAVGNWQTMLSCLVGFVMARFIITRITKQDEVKQIQQETVDS